MQDLLSQETFTRTSLSQFNVLLFGAVVKRTASSLTVSIVLLMTLFSAVLAHAALTWSIQTIDTNSPIGAGVIAVDSNNNPHIAYNHVERYVENKPEYVMYASWDGSSWNTQNVTAGYVIDFKLDSNNNPHILYGGYPNGYLGALMYASWTGTEWRFQIVAQDDWYGGSGSLALDSHGNPHVAYKGNFADGSLIILQR